MYFNGRNNQLTQPSIIEFCVCSVTDFFFSIRHVYQYEHFFASKAHDHIKKEEKKT